MKAAQIGRYSKTMSVAIREVAQPEISDSEVLVRVKAAAVNPVDLLISTGSIKLIQNYPLPLTLGNECSGIVEKAGKNVTAFRPEDAVYARLPISKIGAFAEYAAIDQEAIAKMPEGYDFATAAAIPLTGLTAYQAIVEELEAKPGQTVLIPGGSGSFGQMAVPIAKALGLHVIVTGNARARERFLSMGVDGTFCEDRGWHEAASRYHAFCEAHSGDRVLYLELGVGDNTPVIIKYPFWNAVGQNGHATYACVNIGGACAPAAIAGRSILVDGDIGEAISRIAPALGTNESNPDIRCEPAGR